MAISHRHWYRLGAGSRLAAADRPRPHGGDRVVCTIVVGMVLRKVSSAGVAASFVVVASAVTAVLLLGWRAAVALMAPHRADG
ncbi:transmembrane protein [Mycobacterium tuberculosis]|nr:transmembrane protein [Mycobacterium tuberculosis]